MNIRYKISFSGGVSTSIYTIEDLEDRHLIDSLYFLSNPSIEILSRDFGTGVYSKNGNEVFEGDKIVSTIGATGVVEWKPGGFYVNDIPLGDLKIESIIKEV